MTKIGIAINTRNRPESFRKTYDAWKNLIPEGAELIVVDDASTETPIESDYTFTRNVGTPVAKNKAIEILYERGCTDIFLSDNDCYPVDKDWYKPYIKSPYKHLCFTFKYPTIQALPGHFAFDNPNGCMMYIHKDVINAIGGFDTDYKVYGMWHADFSRRAYNKHLIPYPFMDVIGSDQLFYSMDRKGEVETTTKNRGQFININRKLYHKKAKSKEYIEFRTTPRNTRINYIQPFAVDKNIGKEYNTIVSRIPDDEWVCITDQDVCILSPRTKKQIQEIVDGPGKGFALLGCYTNRLGRKYQRHNKVEVDDNMDMLDHYNRTLDYEQKSWGKVRQYNIPIAGMLMLFPKITWNKVQFKENDIAFDDVFSNTIRKARGKVGLMEGVYVFHFYRGWAENNPISHKEHLK